ncbi:GDSL esterase/lipase 1-like [Gossypium australe]|uniref:GDSL esterase/lipase 1-like n=1 Tax=Gossypium australe TaxID=47621 RepID=A0A5B6X8H6_9ROSI|nr:GDSL esterase/lipase 1-like [Gossypium australe]
MANLSASYISFLLCFTTCINLISSHYLPENHVALFIFGDSLFDPGNNNYINTTADFRANFYPYGETFFKYPTGRFSDGRLIPDFIAQFAGLPIIPTYLQPGKRKFTDGVNFASGGAGALVESHQGYVVDLETQIKYFNKVEKSLRQELGDAGAKKLLSKAVYLISIGGNDYFTKNSSVSDEEFVSMVLGNLTVALKEIYKKGGRKFGFPNLLPLGCLPYIKAQSGGSCIEELTAIAKLHNAELPKTLVKLQNQLEGFKYAYYNLYQSLTERLNNPSKYGFKDATTACCGSGPYRGVYSCGGKRGIEVYELCDKPGDFFFFDSYHPSEKAYRQFAELLWAGNTDIVWPYNLKMLFQDNAFYCTDQFSISMP